MNKNEWYQVGEDIKKQVQSAIDSNDFSELSRTISNTVSQAVNDVGKSINGAWNDAVNEVKNTGGISIEKNGHQKVVRYGNPVYYGKPNLRPDIRYFSRHPHGTFSGALCVTGGVAMMGAAALAAFFSPGGVAAAFTAGVMGIMNLTFLGILAAAGAGLTVYGAKTRGRVRRYRHYVTMVRDKMYCSIEEMAEKIGKSKRFVRKDLKSMMRKQMFLQAHLDKKETCFIASNEMYEQYCLAQKQYEEEKKNTEVKEQEKSYSEELSKVLEEGREYIRVIRLCNDEIPGEEMSGKLDKLELLVTRIFAQVEKEPELATELQKMLSYYLPTTQKLLEAYRDLDKQSVEVKNISDTKKEIEETVDTINQAFERFLDELFREKAWDIQSDISVLNTMLKQDGYLKDDFERVKAGADSGQMEVKHE